MCVCVCVCVCARKFVVTVFCSLLCSGLLFGEIAHKRLFLKSALLLLLLLIPVLLLRPQ